MPFDWSERIIFFFYPLKIWKEFFSKYQKMAHFVSFKKKEIIFIFGRKKTRKKPRNFPPKSEIPAPQNTPKSDFPCFSWGQPPFLGFSCLKNTGENVIFVTGETEKYINQQGPRGAWPPQDPISSILGGISGFFLFGRRIALIFVTFWGYFWASIYKFGCRVEQNINEWLF